MIQFAVRSLQFVVKKAIAVAIAFLCFGLSFLIQIVVDGLPGKLGVAVAF